MYTLTLTQGERQAIDWIGDRYRHGAELFDLLWHSKVDVIPTEEYERPSIYQGIMDWDDNVSFQFNIPEHIAWQIQEIIAEDNYSLACFADSLKSKLMRFADQIV